MLLTKATCCLRGCRKQRLKCVESFYPKGYLSLLHFSGYVRAGNKTPSFFSLPCFWSSDHCCGLSHQGMDRARSNWTPTGEVPPRLFPLPPLHWLRRWRTQSDATGCASDWSGLTTSTRRGSNFLNLLIVITSTMDVQIPISSNSSSNYQ